jgi:hypothetical protein
MMRPIQLSPQTPEQLESLDELYRTTKDVGMRERAQLVLLAAEKGLVAAEIGAIVRLPIPDILCVRLIEVRPLPL